MKSTIIREVSETLNLPVGKAKNIVEVVLQEIKHGIINDNSVTIRGFGSFNVLNKRERIGRNPKTGKDAIISARKVPSFKASKLFKTKVNDSISS